MFSKNRLGMLYLTHGKGGGKTVFLYVTYLHSNNNVYENFYKAMGWNEKYNNNLESFLYIYKK